MMTSAKQYVWEMESFLESSLMSPLMRHQSIIPETTITNVFGPDVTTLDAQTLTCLQDSPYHTLDTVPPNNNSSNDNNNNHHPLILWDEEHLHSPDSSVNSVITRDFEALYDQELWDIPWTDVPNYAEICHATVTNGSSQGTNCSTDVQTLTPKTSPPQLFQCHHLNTGKQSDETICGRIFPDKRGLTRHERNVHTSDGYKCRCSARLITRKDNHRRHVKSCDRIADPQQPVYICRCGMPDSNKDGHLRHLKTCTNRSGGAGRQSETGDV